MKVSRQSLHPARPVEAKVKYRKLCERLKAQRDNLVRSIHQGGPNQDSLGRLTNLVEASGALRFLHREVFPYIEALENGTAPDLADQQ